MSRSWWWTGTAPATTPAADPGGRRTRSPASVRRPVHPRPCARRPPAGYPVPEGETGRAGQGADVLVVAQPAVQPGRARVPGPAGRAGCPGRSERSLGSPDGTPAASGAPRSPERSHHGPGPARPPCADHRRQPGHRLRGGRGARRRGRGRGPRGQGRGRPGRGRRAAGAPRGSGRHRGGRRHRYSRAAARRGGDRQRAGRPGSPGGQRGRHGRDGQPHQCRRRRVHRDVRAQRGPRRRAHPGRAAAPSGRGRRRRGDHLLGHRDAARAADRLRGRQGGRDPPGRHGRPGTRAGPHPGERRQPRFDHVSRRRLGQLPAGQPGRLRRLPGRPVPVRPPRLAAGGRRRGGVPAVRAGVLGHRREHRGGRRPELPERPPLRPPRRITCRRR